MKIRDMPKIESPFIRKEMGVGYCVIPEINPGFEWVFNDDTVIATEKLDGTNVSIVIEGGHITQIYNRTTRIPFFTKGKEFIIEGVLEAFKRGYTNLPDGQYFGEVIGPKLQGNGYNLDKHIWIPFDTYCKKHLAYKSWGKYPKTFEVISEWFENDLFSLFIRRTQNGKVVPPEGIVFHHPDGRISKLRRDMFSWHKGKRHKSEIQTFGGGIENGL